MHKIISPEEKLLDNPDSKINFLPLISIILVCILLLYNYLQVSWQDQNLHSLENLQVSVVQIQESLDQIQEELILETTFPDVESELSADFPTTPTSINFQSNFSKPLLPNVEKFTPTDQGLVILIVSKQSAFQRREIIRKTWASNFPNNYKFLIGKHSCLNEVHDTRYQCLKQNDLATSEIYPKLLAENDQYNDLFLLDFIDTYHNLTTKMKFGFAKTVEYFEPQNLEKEPKTEPKWLFKIDDDAIIFQKNLNTILKKYSERLEPEKYLYFGHFISSKVARTSKNGRAKNVELIYPGIHYPPYATGAAGYLMSFNLIKFFVANSKDLTPYTAEDASMGIWINSTPKIKVHTIFMRQYTNSFSTHGFRVCKGYREKSHKFISIGHRLSDQQLSDCYKWMYGHQNL